MILLSTTVFIYCTYCVQLAGKPWSQKAAVAYKKQEISIEVIFEAIREGDIDKVRLLISKLSSPNEQDFRNRTALFIAAGNGQLQIVKFLYEDLNADSSLAESSLGLTPLIAASFFGHLDVVMYLIEIANVPVDQTDFLNRTSLHMASMEGHASLVEFLIDSAGASLEFRNYHGRTPLLDLSCNSDDEADAETVSLLIEKGANIEANSGLRGMTPLICATSHHNEGMVLLLLEAGANVDARTAKDGRTSLFIAASQSHIRPMKLLIARGHADVEIKDKELQATPLGVAVTNNNLEAATILIELGGANANALIGARPYPLIFMCLVHSSLDALNLMKLLVEKGNADIHAENDFGYTVLLQAALTLHSSCMSYLLAKGAKVDHTNRNGQSALQIASYSGRVDNVLLLLEAGANAALEGHLEVVKMLVEKGGASLRRRSNDGARAIDLARAGNKEEVVKYLTMKEAELQQS